ncbi:MAG: AAA family ATPase [Myxococcales bacterium]|nr:AAA family ATPase [Myxococcales bacterium]
MVITVVGTKGGVGKTLLACQLASYWHSQGLRVVLLDLDPQGTARRFANAANQAGNSCPTTLGVGGDVRKAIREQAEVYDVVVCDTQGRANAPAVTAVVLADLVLAPCAPTVEDLDALQTSTMEIIEQARGIREDLCGLIVRNQWSAQDTNMSTTVYQALQTEKFPVSRTKIRRLVAFNEAVSAGVAVTSKGRSGAAADLLSLVAEIEGILGIQPVQTPEAVAYA